MKMNFISNIKYEASKLKKYMSVGINIIPVIGIKWGILKEYIFKLEKVGNLKIDKTNIDLLDCYHSIYHDKHIYQVFNNIINNEIVMLKNGIQFLNINTDSVVMFIHRFYDNEYLIERNTDPSRTIIDIGANVGDSPIFFAQKGYNVVALEPVPSFYDIAVKNVKLNKHLENKITLINKGASDINGSMDINYNSIGDGWASSYIKNTLYTATVEVSSIQSIIEDNNIENPYLLKMDCEGCENSVILNSDLSMFKRIIFEYHTGFTKVKYEKLVDKLKQQGFEVVHLVGDSEIGVVHLINTNI